jgi:hypothetical protein
LNDAVEMVSVERSLILLGSSAGTMETEEIV